MSSRGQPRKIPCGILGVSLTSLINLRSRLLMPAVGGFLDGFLALEGIIVSPDEESKCKLYLRIYTQMYCIVVFFRELTIHFLMIFSTLFYYFAAILSSLLPYLYPSPFLIRKFSLFSPHFSKQMIIHLYSILYWSSIPNTRNGLVPFLLSDVCSYSKICTHIWRFGAKKLMNENMWCWSLWVWGTSLNMLIIIFILLHED